MRSLGAFDSQLCVCLFFAAGSAPARGGEEGGGGKRGLKVALAQTWWTYPSGMGGTSRPYARQSEII